MMSRQALVGPSTRVFGSTASVFFSRNGFVHDHRNVGMHPGSRFYPERDGISFFYKSREKSLTSTLPWPIFKNITNQT